MQNPSKAFLPQRLNDLVAYAEVNGSRKWVSKQQAPRVTKEGAEMKCGLAHPGELPPLRRK